MTLSEFGMAVGVVAGITCVVLAYILALQIDPDP